MGWQGYESTIEVGMLFKKRYCYRCGQRLKINKVINVYKRGEPGFKKDICGSSTIGMGSIKIVTYNYKCPNCNNIITCSEQDAIAKLQKLSGKTILTDNELTFEKP